MDNINRQYKCNICNKIYSSYKSLWNHNKKFHIIEDNINNISNNLLKYECDYCNKKFKNYQNRWKHKKICKNKELENNKETNENKVKKLENELDIIKNQLNELLNKNCKMHPKTFQKINKQLNTNNINNGTINNNTINLVAIGSENLSDVLNKKEKINILKDMYGSLGTIVKYVHFNDKFPQFKTIVITNLQNNVAYKYNDDESRFLTLTKEELLNDLISARLDDLQCFNDEVGDKLDIYSKKKIDAFLEEMETNDKLVDLKKGELKIILYNNRKNVEMIK